MLRYGIEKIPFAIYIIPFPIENDRSSCYDLKKR